MEYYNLHSSNKQKTTVKCPKVTNSGSICNGDDFEISNEQYLLGKQNDPIFNVRLVCNKCKRTFIKCFDAKSFYEQFDYFTLNNK